MKIRDIEFKDIAFLAPMAGVTDRAFRELCASFGAAYTVTEMVSSKGLVMGDRKSAFLLHRAPGISGAQIFGDEPETMALAAVKCLEHSPDIIDINMGCPAPKVAMNGGGASLMKDIALAGRIVRAVRDAVDIPVTVKIRKGWDDAHINAAELARALEANGADAIAVHGRTRAQMYSGSCDLETIAAVKRAVSVPVIGNGDVKDAYSAAKMLEETGCDAVMIGRGAMGNPWIFRQINAYIGSGAVIPPPSLEERLSVMLRHIEKTVLYKGERTAMHEARRHAAYYTKGLRGGAGLRRRMSSLETLDELRKIAFDILRENENDL